MADSPNLAMPYIEAAQAQKHVTHNEALDVLDAVVQLSVLDRHLATPPASASEGDRYIIASGATGAWAGHDGKLAAFQAGAWVLRVPREGWLAWVQDEDLALVFDGIEWLPFAGDASVLQNVQLLGIGTTADQNNPLSATVNSALLNALPAGAGGTGDLRCIMNKETQANTVSVLFQDNFSGRAEIGLMGEDAFVLKTSADGSAWTEALRAGTNGTVALAANPKFAAFLDADQLVAADSWTTISLNQTEFDNRSAFNTTSHLFTAPVAGAYLFGASCLYKIDASANARMRARLWKNGATVIPGSLGGITGTHTTTVTALWLSVATMLAQGDTVALQGFFAAESGLFAAIHTRLWGMLLT
ncbi:DUF2793 domain-containing protein [Rhodoligotrophos defluvii]|uniref:DUF2793 domain-containing protein n=1 Tax=Rhodoligotrophos defluvii TaxID=2561934 RepID=UPI0010C9D59E|nr:DUF2793 domain-containing protein [Rhodoligotrophos defluvii]